MKRTTLAILILLLAVGTLASAAEKTKVPFSAIKPSCYGEIDMAKEEFVLSEVGKECVIEEWLDKNAPEEKSSSEEKTTSEKKNYQVTIFPDSDKDAIKLSWDGYLSRSQENLITVEVYEESYIHDRYIEGEKRPTVTFLVFHRDRSGWGKAIQDLPKDKFKGPGGFVEKTDLPLQKEEDKWVGEISVDLEESVKSISVWKSPNTSQKGHYGIDLEVVSKPDEKAGLPELKEGMNLISENSAKGFKWPYFVYIPRGYFDENGGHTSEVNKILIESVNTGTSSDSYEIHKKAARRIASEHGLARRLNTPGLVPTYPRPRSGKRNYRYYTHALDRDTLKIDEENDKLYRIDQQLIAMADHLLSILAESHDVNLEDEFFVYGYSASGNFANRLAMLHPDRIAAVAAGGLNGMPIIPKKRAEGEAERKINLTYPIGLYDIDDLAGAEIDLDAYRDTPQFLFMGSEDHNDTLGYGDAFGDTERDKILEFFDTCIIDPPDHSYYEPGGKYYNDVCDGEYSEEMIDRFELAKEMYEERDLPAKFVVYKGAGHTPRPAYSDVLSFFRGGYKNIDGTELVWR